MILLHLFDLFYKKKLSICTLFYFLQLRIGSKEIVEKAKDLCIRFIIRYQTRPVPTPENALLLPTFIFQKKQEISLEVCMALRRAAFPSKPGMATDNSIKIETRCHERGLVVGFIPGPFRRKIDG